MSITRGQFLRSLGKSLPGMVASTGMATAAHTLIRRMAQAVPPVEAAPASAVPEPPVPYLQRGPETSDAIALTFDDGPEPGVTERLLDTLQAHGLRATFFMIGEKVAAAPELARRVAEHDVEDELEKTDAIFMEVMGRRADWFRPPFGALRQDQARRVRARGMRVALWSLDTEDWRGGSAAAITERIAMHTHPGAIVLCHDTRGTAESLDATLSRLLDTQRWRPVTLTELFGAPAL
jgi:peptidoglycan/xylan/chitin deacetylase (PgdA/CDA1 family)